MIPEVSSARRVLHGVDSAEPLLHGGAVPGGGRGHGLTLLHNVFISRIISHQSCGSPCLGLVFATCTCSEEPRLVTGGGTWLPQSLASSGADPSSPSRSSSLPCSALQLPAFQLKCQRNFARVFTSFGKVRGSSTCGKHLHYRNLTIRYAKHDAFSE